MKKRTTLLPALMISFFICIACVSFALYFSRHPIELTIPTIAPIAHDPSPSPQDNTKAQVAYVVDGDTIDVLMENKKVRIRLIGVNAPEEYEGKNPECFADEATAFVRTRLSGKLVTLEADTSQDNVDKYGRLLRYVYLEDGTNIDLELIKQGFAREYTYKVPYRYQQVFREAQMTARSSNIGLWGRCH